MDFYDDFFFEVVALVLAGVFIVAGYLLMRVKA